MSSVGQLQAGQSLSEGQQYLYDFMNNTNESVFITGKAGSGKSFLLKYFVEHTDKQVVVLATTGTAALNLEVRGQTIHSFFHLRPGHDTRFLSQDVIDTLKSTDTIVIDEVSMLRADLIELIAKLIYHARIDRSQPFGGIQLIFFGDLYQLPPVVVKDELADLMRKFGGVHFFNSPAIQSMNLKIFELQDSHRQQEGEFLVALNHIRDATTTRGMARLINSRVLSAPEGILNITTTNAKAKAINDRGYDKLNTQEQIYIAKVDGNFKPAEYPVDFDLSLKVGSKVQLTRNHPELLWSNGSLGEITELGDRYIRVLIDGLNCTVKPNTWEKVEQHVNKASGKIEASVVGTFTQLPIKLAWAITIHKSQGQTYDEVVIDWGNGTFCEGQAYTALSRCRTLEGLYMTSEIKPHYIASNPDILEFMRGAIEI